MGSLIARFPGTLETVEACKQIFNKSTLRTVVVFFLVFGLEKVFAETVFNCPEDHHLSYGAMFIFGPAFCLFNIAVLLNSQFWEAVTGCYRRVVKGKRGRKRRICKLLAKHIFQSTLPALIWLCLAFVEGKYYVCARLGPEKVAEELAEGDEKELQMIRDRFAHIKAESQMLAWGIFLSVVFFSTTFVLARRCFCLETEGSLPSVHEFDREEAEAAAKAVREKMIEVARETGKMRVEELFDQCKPHPGVDQMKDILSKIAKLYPRTTGDLSEPYRSDEPVIERNGNIAMHSHV